MTDLLLDDKTALIYGGGGAIGGAVARVSPGEGARVFVAGAPGPSSVPSRATSPVPAAPREPPPLTFMGLHRPGVVLRDWLGLLGAVDHRSGDVSDAGVSSDLGRFDMPQCRSPA